MREMEYYKPIKKVGTHLADSKKVIGAKSGNLLNNSNNKANGSAAWIKASDLEMAKDLIMKNKGKVAVGGLLIAGAFIIVGMCIEKSKNNKKQKKQEELNKQQIELEKQQIQDEINTNKKLDEKELDDMDNKIQQIEDKKIEIEDKKYSLLDKMAGYGITTAKKPVCNIRNIQKPKNGIVLT